MNFLISLTNSDFPTVLTYYKSCYGWSNWRKKKVLNVLQHCHKVLDFHKYMVIVNNI